MPEGKYIHADERSHAAVAWDVITLAINYSISLDVFQHAEGDCLSGSVFSPLSEFHKKIKK